VQDSLKNFTCENSIKNAPIHGRKSAVCEKNGSVFGIYVKFRSWKLWKHLSDEAYPYFRERKEIKS